MKKPKKANPVLVEKIKLPETVDELKAKIDELEDDLSFWKCWSFRWYSFSRKLNDKMKVRSITEDMVVHFIVDRYESRIKTLRIQNSINLVSVIILISTVVYLILSRS